ncbi:MAG: membrane integrity-associated transporter subunit PqiC [Gammaproteobacteria bacterium]|nr:membrane integrity-associated transporter subunit PqiC [Gammaproteobacteria bacterium]
MIELMRLVPTAAILLLSACASAPQTRYYSLDDFAGRQDAACAANNSAAALVKVQPFNVLPPFDTMQIVYRPPDLPQTIGFYASHQWATPPARMLAQATVDYLCRAGINAELTGLAVNIGEAVIVSADVSELLEVDTREGPSGRVALTLRVSNSNGIVFEKHAWGRAMAQERTVDSVVEAIDQALQAALSGVRAPLERLLAGTGAE